MRALTAEFRSGFCQTCPLAPRSGGGPQGSLCRSLVFPAELGHGMD